MTPTRCGICGGSHDAYSALCPRGVAQGVTPVGQQPDLQPPRGGFNKPPVDDLNELAYLAYRIEQAILDRAATWEVEFVEGPPGHAVGVADAALIAAQEVLGA